MVERLEVEDLVHHYGSKTALDGISFRVGAGRFCALLGPNGAGKSTLFNLLTRLFVPQSGRIKVAGFDLAKSPNAALARLGVVFQQPTLDLDLTVQRNMRYYAALHGLSASDADRRIAASLERLQMGERAREKVRALNGGHRRRMEIARALLHEPDILLLDEPTVGLDAATRRSITDHVHALCADTGLTVLWATHLVDEIDEDDHLLVLHEGRILADGDAGDIAGGQPLADRFLAMTGGLQHA